MKPARFAIRSLNDVASRKPWLPLAPRSFSANANEGLTTESRTEPSRSIFAGRLDVRRKTVVATMEKAVSSTSILARRRKDKRELGRSYGKDGSRGSNRDETFDPSSDGVDGKLKEAALIYNIDDEEGGVKKDGYSFRPDVNSWGANHFPKVIESRCKRPRQNNKAEITTEEVLKKADFRNVRFLAQFITEAGILVKRKQTGISAKAQRKIAREIKTARAFGLMPFTTMGTKAFTFGKTMENRDQDFEYEVVDDDG
ncbi:Ribosomal protein S18 [Raphanus sativus]|nr:Ribosomal protein S18 [Raphanus sativus]